LRQHSDKLADCLARVTESLRVERPEYGRDVAIDASDLPAWANGQRYVSKNGPERKRYSDPDASWGHRSAISTRKGGGFYGYKLHIALCTATDLPLAWEVRTARDHESPQAIPLLDAVRARGFQPQTLAADKGYDSSETHSECATRSVLPVIPARVHPRHKQLVPPLEPDGSYRFPLIPRDSQRFRDLYKRRVAVEREFGRLKHDY